MELEDLKNIWESQDGKLEANLKLNTALLRNLNFEKAQKELRKPRTGELIQLIAIFVLTTYLVWISILMWSQYEFAIPSLLAALASIGIIVIAVIRYRKLLAINFYDDSILGLQSRLYKLQNFMLKIGRLELVFNLIALMMMWPVILFTGFGIDIYLNLSYLILVISLVSIIALPLGFSYWKAYQQKLINAGNLLDEIKELEV